VGEQRLTSSDLLNFYRPTFAKSIEKGVGIDRQIRDLRRQLLRGLISELVPECKRNLIRLLFHDVANFADAVSDIRRHRATSAIDISRPSVSYKKMPFPCEMVG
jgi:hypothetical protein